MKNYRFYLYITLSLITFLVLSCIITTPIIVKSQITTLLDNNISSAQQKTKQLTKLSGEFFKDEMSKDRIIKGIQNGIKNTHEKTTFNSVIDWSGKILAYPDAILLGTQINQDGAPSPNVENSLTGAELYEYIITSKQALGASSPNIIYLEPIPESDMMIAAHINYNDIETAIANVKNQTYIIFFVPGLLALLALLITTRILSSYYEAQLAMKSTKIEDSVQSLGKLNQSIESYQKNLLEIKEQTNESSVKENISEPSPSKQRLLTYVRNELRPINVEDIAYVYVENKITYIVCLDEKRSTSNESLDQIYTSLDVKFFFRANRQIILNIEAIDKIIKFGNNTLKIQTKPASEIDIIIGKNKAASFRQWLDL